MSREGKGTTSRFTAGLGSGHGVAPVQPVPQALPALPGIEAAVGLAYMGGDAALYRRMLVRVRDEQGAAFATAFRAARMAGDWDTAARLAHNLKGQMRMIGAKALSEQAESLERAIHRREAEQADALEAGIAPVLERVMAGLAAIVPDPVAQPAAPVPGDRAGAEAALAQFERLLATGDSEAALRLGEFRQAMEAVGWPAPAREAIGHAAERYDFARAASLLRLEREARRG